MADQWATISGVITLVIAVLGFIIKLQRDDIKELKSTILLLQSIAICERTHEDLDKFCERTHEAWDSGCDKIHTEIMKTCQKNHDDLAKASHVHGTFGAAGEVIK